MLRVMRYLAALAIALTACSTAPDTRSPADVVEFLLTSAATDLHTHGQSGPLRFRDVRIGHVDDHYMLCGQFQRGTGEWIPFVTIKTSGYEQWIGARKRTAGASGRRSNGTKRAICRPPCRPGLILCGNAYAFAILRTFCCSSSTLSIT